MDGATCKEQKEPGGTFCARHERLFKLMMEAA
jgi:hypothetical protein